MHSDPIPFVRIGHEAQALLTDLAAMGEQLPAEPTIYGRSVPPAPTCPPPYEVLDLGHNPTPHQTRCRLCSWQSRWCSTAGEAHAEHDWHQREAHLRTGEVA